MKIDKLKAEIDFLRDRYKNYFIVVIGLFGGSFGVFFQVLIKKMPLFMDIFAFIGIVFGFIFLDTMKNIKKDIIENINQIEEL